MVNGEDRCFTTGEIDVFLFAHQVFYLLFNYRENNLDCRIGCGACCIALSISSPILGMPNGKTAGVRCMQLSPDNRCLIYDKPERPTVCLGLRPWKRCAGKLPKKRLRIWNSLNNVPHPPLIPPIVRLSSRRSQGRESHLAPCG